MNYYVRALCFLILVKLKLVQTLLIDFSRQSYSISLCDAPILRGVQLFVTTTDLNQLLGRKGSVQIISTQQQPQCIFSSPQVVEIQYQTISTDDQLFISGQRRDQNFSSIINITGSLEFRIINFAQVSISSQMFDIDNGNISYQFINKQCADKEVSLKDLRITDSYFDGYRSFTGSLERKYASVSFKIETITDDSYIFISQVTIKNMNQFNRNIFDLDKRFDYKADIYVVKIISVNLTSSLIFSLSARVLITQLYIQTCILSQSSGIIKIQSFSPHQLQTTYVQLVQNQFIDSFILQSYDLVASSDARDRFTIDQNNWNQTTVGRIFDDFNFWFHMESWNISLNFFTSNSISYRAEYLTLTQSMVILNSIMVNNTFSFFNGYTDFMTIKGTFRELYIQDLEFSSNYIQSMVFRLFQTTTVQKVQISILKIQGNQRGNIQQIRSEYSQKTQCNHVLQIQLKEQLLDKNQRKKNTWQLYFISRSANPLVCDYQCPTNIFTISNKDTAIDISVNQIVSRYSNPMIKFSQPFHLQPPLIVHTGLCTQLIIKNVEISNAQLYILNLFHFSGQSQHTLGNQIIVQIYNINISSIYCDGDTSTIFSIYATGRLNLTLQYIILSQVEYTYGMNAFRQNPTFLDLNSPDSSIHLSQSIFRQINNPYASIIKMIVDSATIEKIQFSQLNKEKIFTTQYEGLFSAFGGSLNVKAHRILISKCQFDNLRAYSGSALYVQMIGKDARLLLQNSIFQNLISTTFLESSKVDYSNQGGAMYLLISGSRQSIDIKQCSFIQLTSGLGGAIKLSQLNSLQSNFRILNSTFQNILCLQGSVLHLDEKGEDCGKQSLDTNIGNRQQKLKVSLKNTFINDPQTRYIQNYQPMVFYIREANVSINLTEINELVKRGFIDFSGGSLSIQFTHLKNFSLSGQLILLTNVQNIFIQDVSFMSFSIFQLTSSSEFITIQNQNDNDARLVFSKVVFYDINFADYDRFLHILNYQVAISKIKFIRMNVMLSTTNGLQTSVSRILINIVQGKFRGYDIILQKLKLSLYYCVLNIFHSNFHMDKLKIQRVLIKDRIQSLFSELAPQQDVGVISILQNSYSYNMISRSLFTDLQTPGRITFLEYKFGKLVLIQNIFSNLKGYLYGSLNIENANTSLSQVIFQDCNIKIAGGGIYSVNSSLYLEQSTIVRNQGGQRGGAIYFTSQNKTTFRITDCNISDNSADVAGAVYVFGVILETSQEMKGHARLFGDQVVTYPEAMKIYVKKDEAFDDQEIYAMVEQGRECPLQISIQSNLDCYFTTQRESSQKGFTFVREILQLAPGLTDIFLYITLTDAQGVNFKMNFQKPIQLNISYYNDSRKQIFTPKSSYSDKSGVFSVENLRPFLPLKANEEAEINISTENIQVPIYKDFLFTKFDTQNKTFIPSLIFILSFRKCVPGEESTAAETCKKCEDRAQFSELNSNNILKCRPCVSSVMDCRNGQLFLLHKGYWRQNENKTAYVECLNNHDACQERRTDMYVQCRSGHTGPLCESCKNTGGWVNSDRYNCRKCDSDQTSNIKDSFQLTSSILIVFMMASISIINHIKSVQYTQTCFFLRRMNMCFLGRSSMLAMMSGSYLKMIIHYVQIMMAIETLNLPVKKSAFDVFSSFGNPTNQNYYKLDCQLLKYSNESFRLLYLRLLFSVLLPLVHLFMLIILFLIGDRKGYLKFSTNTIQSTILFLLNYFQVGVCQKLISLLTYKQIFDKKYVYADLGYEYDSQLHSRFLGFFIFPLFLAWALVFPMTLLLRFFFILFRLDLGQGQISLVSQFLYKDYKQSTYAWELTKMAEKIIVVFIINQFSSKTQFTCVAIIMVLLVYYFLAQYFQPYFTAGLNSDDRKQTFDASIQYILALMMLVQGTDSTIAIMRQVMALINVYVMMRLIFGFFGRFIMVLDDRLKIFLRGYINKQKQSQHIKNAVEQIGFSQRIMLRKAKQPLIEETIGNWKRLRVMFLKKQINDLMTQKKLTTSDQANDEFQQEQIENQTEDEVYNQCADEIRTTQNEEEVLLIVNVNPRKAKQEKVVEINYQKILSKYRVIDNEDWFIEQPLNFKPVKIQDEIERALDRVLNE